MSKEPRKEKLMRIIFVLLCTLALAFAANGAQEKEKKTKKGATAAQVSHPQRRAETTGARPGATGKPAKPAKPVQAMKRAKPVQAGKPAKPGRPAQFVRPSGGAQAGAPQQTVKRAKPKPAQTATVAEGRYRATVTRPTGKPQLLKPKRFDLAVNTRPTKFAAVTFQQNRRIVGSENWVGPQYRVFREYRPVWHDRYWWRRHYSRIVFAFGGWYYWNAGWWYPAWGYDPGAYYVWDGPIYAYHGLPPDQVVANVQAALQEQGYYRGEVDGLLGPLTRAALADYQRDHGLYMTAAIDRPTLESLGMA
jgi:hypothetical protein